MKDVNALISRIYNAMAARALDFDYYPGCSEPGYDDVPVIAANWNPLPMKKWGDLIERLERNTGALQLQWSDEWTGCSNCGKAVRTSADSYAWQSSLLWASDCAPVCRKCWAAAYDDIIETYKVDYHYNSIIKVLPADFANLKQFRQEWVCWSDRTGQCPTYVTGYHPGQDDDPQKVFDHIMEVDHTLDVVFVIRDVGQFDVHWQAYVRETDSDND